MFYGQPQKFNVHHKSFQNMKEYIIKIEKMQKKVNGPLAPNQYLGIYIGQDVLFCLIYFVCIAPYYLPDANNKTNIDCRLRKILVIAPEYVRSQTLCCQKWSFLLALPKGSQMYKQGAHTNMQMTKQIIIVDFEFFLLQLLNISGAIIPLPKIRAPSWISLEGTQYIHREQILKCKRQWKY